MGQELRNDMKGADPTALGCLTLAVVLLNEIPIMIGAVSPVTWIAALPWALAGTIALMIVVVFQLRQGDLLSATANGLLGIILIGTTAFKGVISLLMMITKTASPDALITGGCITDAMAWLGAGIATLFIGYLVGKISGIFSVAVWSAAIGFFLIAASNAGVVGAGMSHLAGYFIGVIAVWFLYLGIASLMNGIVQKNILPLGKPWF